MITVFFIDNREMAPREWQQVTILDEQLSRMFVVGPQGLSDEDLEAVTGLVLPMLRGDVDTVNLVPARGAQVDAAFIDSVNEQVSVALASAQYQPRSGEGIDLGVYGDPRVTYNDPYAAYDDKGRIYTDLHFDGLRKRFARNQENITESGFRFHFTKGSVVRKGNIPSGYNFSDFDPYFVLGRVAQEEYARVDREQYERGTLALSYETFVPSVAVDQRSPIWTLFRNTGSPQGPNFPVAHTLIPRMILDVITDPDVIFSELDTGDELNTGGNQTALIATATDIIEVPIRTRSRSPFSKPDPLDPVNPYPFGHRRNYTATDFTGPNSEPRGLST